MDPPNFEWEPNALIAFDSLDAAEGFLGLTSGRAVKDPDAPQRDPAER
jgi:hypothetical protein